MPPNLELNAGFVSSTNAVATSSYPYYGNGPIDFSQLNFVKTEQTDYFYDTVGSSSQEVLVSKVTQTYDPNTAFLIITGLMVGFFWALAYGITKVRKMGK